MKARSQKKSQLSRLFVLTLCAALVGTVALAQDREDWNPAEPLVSEKGPDGTPFVPLGTVLYDNGSLINCAGCGVGGADESVLQTTSLGMNTLGFGHQVAFDNRVADDFEVTDAAGWDIDTITFFAYQTGSTTTSTMTAVNLRIWDGMPGGGGAVVFGDTTTNLLTTTVWSNIYRVTETTTGAATDRPIMASTLALAAPVHLDAGTYWLDWQTDGTLGSGPWAPPVTINATCITGDGLQSLDAGVTFGAANDSGTGTCQQAFPFVIEGVATGGVPAMPPGALALLALALLLAGLTALRVRRQA